MQTKLNIRQYGHHGHPITTPHFFVLCKGENAGKPLDAPCANSFVVYCSSDQEREYFFWLSWGLWKSKSFHIALRGSVIPFITIPDYSKIMAQAAVATNDNPEVLHKAIRTMRDLENFEALISQKMKLARQLQQAIFTKVLKRAEHTR